MTVAEMIAGAALLVSIIAAYYAYRAPVRAEHLRNQSLQKEKEAAIFNVLMAERGRWGSPAMLSALNSVKIVFRNNQPILDAWYVMHSNVGGPNGKDDHYLDLIAAIANHLGQTLRREDLANYFTSPVEWKEAAIRTHQVNMVFEQLTANSSISTPSASVSQTGDGYGG